MVVFVCGDYCIYAALAYRRSAPRAPEGHRRPHDFNRYTDWVESDTNWGDKNLKSFIRDAHFKITSHKSKTVDRVEYIFGLPPYYPIHEQCTATVVDLDHPQFDNVFVRTSDD